MKKDCDPVRWEPFDREIEVGLIRIYKLEWVEEKAWMGADRLWHLKGKWSRERSVYAKAASGKIELDILLHAAPASVDKERVKEEMVARVTQWLKSIPKEASLPPTRSLGINLA